MRRIFLGPALHWLIVLAVVALGWFSGLGRTHVSQFNPFILMLIGMTVVLLLIVLKTSPPGTQVTREPLDED
ncbi:MAG: hypothetical protein AAF479_05420 [Pseudomonadota bacterium]